MVVFLFGVYEAFGEPVAMQYEGTGQDSHPHSRCFAHGVLQERILSFVRIEQRNAHLVADVKLNQVRGSEGNTVFYDGKMGLDADGSPYSQKTPGVTDQPKTSLRYSLPGKPSINADRVPFIVIPLGGFDKALGVKVGDVAAVVYGPKLVFAAVADEGPPCKLGEGSIQLHELLGHGVCQERASNGDCTKLRNVGIERGLLYFIFPGTNTELMPGSTPENVNARLEAIGSSAWRQLTSP